MYEEYQVKGSMHDVGRIQATGRIGAIQATEGLPKVEGSNVKAGSRVRRTAVGRIQRVEIKHNHE